MPAAERDAVAVFHDEGELPAGTRLAIAIEDGARRRDARGAPIRAAAPAVLGAARARRAPDVERILVTTGGGALQAAGVATAAALRDAYPDVTVALVRGPYATFEAPRRRRARRRPAVAARRNCWPPTSWSRAARPERAGGGATGAATVAVPLAPTSARTRGRWQRAGAAVIAEAGRGGRGGRPSSTARRWPPRASVRSTATARCGSPGASPSCSQVRNSSSSRVTSSGWSSARK